MCIPRGTKQALQLPKDNNSLEGSLNSLLQSLTFRKWDCICRLGKVLARLIGLGSKSRLGKAILPHFRVDNSYPRHSQRTSLYLSTPRHYRVYRHYRLPKLVHLTQ